MQAIEGPIRAILKMKRKNRRRLYTLLGVLLFFYYKAVATRFDKASQSVVKVLSFVIQQLRILKPKSKRLQYVVLLATAFVAKYLTRVDVFPDDLDYQVANQSTAPSI